MKREKEKNLIQNHEENKEPPMLIPMLCGAIILICLTISLVAAFPALTRSDELSFETQESDFTADNQKPSSNPSNTDNQNPNDFMNEFDSSNNAFGGENIGYDIFVD